MGNADHQGREHQRADQHLDQAQKNIGDDRDITGHPRGGGFVGKCHEYHLADDDSEHQPSKDQPSLRAIFFMVLTLSIGVGSR